jgi:hypothetical protein
LTDAGAALAREQAYTEIEQPEKAMKGVVLA